MNEAISKYISNQNSKQKEILLELRKTIKQIIPNAEEKMSYGVPSFRLNGKSILYAAFKEHIGLYPEPEVVEFFKDQLEKYETAKGTIKFKLNEPIPYDLIKRIVLYKYNL